MQGLLGSGNVQFQDQGAGYLGVFTLDHLIMICILLCMYDKPHNKVYQKKKFMFYLLSWQQKKLFFFFFFLVRVAMQLKSSRSWNFHILLEAVYMNTAFSGEQFSTMDLNS